VLHQLTSGLIQIVEGASMDLGTGIFLSTALLAVVLLYYFTKDRWRWRKLIVRTLFFGLILIGGSVAVIALVHYWDELFPVQLGRQTQYAGLKLGMNPQEVMYVKGYPPEVLEPDEDPIWKGVFKNIKTSELKQGKKATDFKRWSYDQYKSYLLVEFNNERTALVAIRCYSEDKAARCPPVGSVSDGTSEKDALSKLGGPAEQRIDGGTKDLRFSRLGAKLWLTRGAGLHA
jgi:hypothetical protein